MSTFTKEMLEEVIALIHTPSDVKKAFFGKFFPSINDIENYSVILPESFREFESRFEWIYIDKFLPKNKAYAVDTKAILEPPKVDFGERPL